MNFGHGFAGILNKKRITFPAVWGTLSRAWGDTSWDTYRDCQCRAPVRFLPAGLGCCRPWKMAPSWRSAWGDSYHGGKHGAGGPNVQRVVVIVVVHQQLRPLEIPRSHSHVVILSHVVELSQSPVNQFQYLLVRVDDDVLRLNIPMHYSLAVTVIQSLHHMEGTLSSSKR